MPRACRYAVAAQSFCRQRGSAADAAERAQASVIRVKVTQPSQARLRAAVFVRQPWFNRSKTVYCLLSVHWVLLFAAVSL